MTELHLLQYDLPFWSHQHLWLCQACSSFIQYFPALPDSVNMDTCAALSMDNSGGFHKYVHAFLRQAAEVVPSEAEKIHNFKRGFVRCLAKSSLAGYNH